MQMIATSDIEYPPGKSWKPGDAFEVEEEHVHLLKTIGRAKLPDAPQNEAAATTAPAAVPTRPARSRPARA